MSYGDAVRHDDLPAARDDSIVSCSLACIRFIDFSTASVKTQLRWKAELNDLLAQALTEVDPSERIVLDADEGIAIVFLGSPQRCLAFALSLRDALPQRPDAPLPVRVALNVGPVRLLQDGNGAPRLMGDALLVGERIAGFADADRMLVSHSFYEALGAEHADRFSFEGTRTDSKVREHRIYSLRGAARSSPSSGERAVVPDGAIAAALSQLRFTASAAGARILARPRLATVLAAVAILSGGFALRQMSADSSAPSTATAKDRMATTTMLAAESRTPSQEALGDTPIASDRAALPEQQAGSQGQAARLHGVPVGPIADAAAGPRSGPQAASAEAIRRSQQLAAEATGAVTSRSAAAPARDAATPARDDAAGPGAVRLTVVPWGEVYLDGEMLGVTPPLRDLALEPGVYRIEIRNPGFASLLQVVEVNAGKEIRIRHRFE